MRRTDSLSFSFVRLNPKLVQRALIEHRGDIDNLSRMCCQVNRDVKNHIEDRGHVVRLVRCLKESRGVKRIQDVSGLRYSFVKRCQQLLSGNRSSFGELSGPVAV